MIQVHIILLPGQRIVKRIRVSLFGSMVQQEIAFFDQTKTGELINRLSTDTTLVGRSLTNNVSDGLRSTAQAIGGIGMMVSCKCKCNVIARVTMI